MNTLLHVGASGWVQWTKPAITSVMGDHSDTCGRKATLCFERATHQNHWASLRTITFQARLTSTFFLCSVHQHCRLQPGWTLVSMATRCRFFHHGLIWLLQRKPDLSTQHFVSVSSFRESSLVYTDSLWNTGRHETRETTSTHLHSLVPRNLYHKHIEVELIQSDQDFIQ